MDHVFIQGGNTVNKRTINWSSGTWLNQPQNIKAESTDLIVNPIKGADFWQQTLYGFNHKDGAALLIPWNKENAIEVSFQASSLNTLYDQAGLFIYHSPEQWVKAGIEISDGTPQLSVVVTNAFSDWSLSAVPEWSSEEVTLRASMVKDAIIIRARTVNFSWRTVRVIHSPFESPNQIGLFAISPNRSNLKVKFTGWFSKAKDINLHSDPIE